jgi:hypothetical protein
MGIVSNQQMHLFGNSSRCLPSYSLRAKIDVDLINITQKSINTEPPPSRSDIIPVVVSGLSQHPNFVTEIFVGNDCSLLFVALS